MGFAHNNIKTKVEDTPPLEFDYSDSFLDSLLNFDSWAEDPTKSSLAEVMNSEDHTKSSLAEVMNSEEKPNCSEIKRETENEAEDVCKLGDLIEEGMDKVCLTEDVSANEVIKEDGDIKDSADLEDESSSESSSSSSSSDDEDDDEDDEDDDDEEYVKDLTKLKGEVEIEEGEIKEEMVDWSDDEEGDVVKGPILSKNEIQDLPPVPPVNVTIQPHHQTLPVGVVLSIMGAQVVVEGVENHNPLSEGSILWVTESRTPLGVVDEIFGPVKNPYYIVRYNSEIEIPSGIQQGSLISFVPEFADFVLNNNNLYKKGYDASGENDEEISEELEFSDDEKEAEYKKMIKMSKRNSNGNMKKDKKPRNRGGNRKNDNQPLVNSQVNNNTPNGPANGPTNGPHVFSAGPQMQNFTGPPTGVWPNGFQPQNMGFPPNVFPIMQPNFGQPPNFSQQPFQNAGGFNPQFNPNGQMFNPNFVPPNFPFWAPAQNQSQPMMFQGGNTMPDRFQMENNNNGVMRPQFNAGSGQNSNNNGVMRPQFNAGNGEFSNQGNGFSNRGGRRPFQRGGGRSGPR